MLKAVKQRISLILPMLVASARANLLRPPVLVDSDPRSLRLLAQGSVLLVAMLQPLGNRNKLSPPLSVVLVLPRNHSNKPMPLVNHRRQVMRSEVRQGLLVSEALAPSVSLRISRPAPQAVLAHLINRNLLPDLGLLVLPPPPIPRRVSGPLGSSSNNNNSNSSNSSSSNRSSSNRSNHSRLTYLGPSLLRGDLGRSVKQVGDFSFFYSFFIV